MVEEDAKRLGQSHLPEGNASVLASGEKAARPRYPDCIDGAIMDPQHPHGGAVLDRPDDRRLVEAAGDRQLTFWRHGEGPDRPAMTLELCPSRSIQGDAEEQAGEDPRSNPGKAFDVFLSARRALVQREHALMV